MNQNKNRLVQAIKYFTDTRVLGLIGFGVVAVLITVNGVQTVQKNYELEKQISVARQKNQIKKLENQNLRLKATYYQTNQFLELAARRQLGKSAPGERLYLVPESVAMSRTVESPKAATVVEPQPVPEAKKSNFQQWMSFLFRVE